MIDDEEDIPQAQNKAELLSHIEAEWTALMNAVNRLTPEQMARPDAGGWSPKDNLAHLAAWERWLVRYHLGGEAPHHVFGLDEESFNRLDETAMNALIFERNKDKPAHVVLAELHETHRQVLARLDELSAADLYAPRYDDDPEERPVLDWVIGDTYEHYQEHRRTIEASAGS